MRELLEEIAQTNEYEIGELLKAVLQRYAVLFPDWDVSTISLNKIKNTLSRLLSEA